MISWDSTSLTSIKIYGVEVVKFSDLLLLDTTTGENLAFWESEFTKLEESIEFEINSILSEKNYTGFEFRIKFLHRDSESNELIYMTWFGPPKSTPPWLEESYLNSDWVSFYE